MAVHKLFIVTKFFNQQGKQNHYSLGFYLFYEKLSARWQHRQH